MRSFGDFLEQPVADLAGPLLGAELRASDTIPPGTRIGGCRVIRELGRGGMGVVCLAERESDGEQLALKVVLRRFALEPSTLRRFREERDLLAPLEHPGIARLLDAGVERDGTLWLAMEYVDGVAIDAYCAAHGLDVPAKLALFAAACDAVAHAHEASIVHRDLKPSHVLVTADAHVKLLDFGIAKLSAAEGTGPSAPTFTQPQLLTPAYASPEQLRGEHATAASDVYALGVILYRLLTGRMPPRRAADVVSRSASRRAKGGARRFAPSRTENRGRVLGPEWPDTVDHVVAKALAPEPGQRFPSARELAQAVRQIR